MPFNTAQNDQAYKPTPLLRSRIVLANDLRQPSFITMRSTQSAIGLVHSKDSGDSQPNISSTFPLGVRLHTSIWYFVTYDLQKGCGNIGERRWYPIGMEVRNTRKFTMRKLFVALLLTLALAMASVAPAFAHVHGVTPLAACTTDNSSNSGGKGANGTPADAANGGPIKGLIPRDTGNAPLTVGDGGFGATDCQAPA